MRRSRLPSALRVAAVLALGGCAARAPERRPRPENTALTPLQRDAETGDSASANSRLSQGELPDDNAFSLALARHPDIARAIARRCLDAYGSDPSCPGLREAALLDDKELADAFLAKHADAEKAVAEQEAVVSALRNALPILQNLTVFTSSVTPGIPPDWLRSKDDPRDGGASAGLRSLFERHSRALEFLQALRGREIDSAPWPESPAAADLPSARLELRWIGGEFVLWSTPSGGADPAETDGERASHSDGRLAVGDVIPLTVGNLRGHRMLFDEGWFVVTSSAKALDYARRKSILSSRDALRQARIDAARRARTLGQSAAADLARSEKTRVDISSAAAAGTAAVRKEADALSRGEFRYAEDGFARAARSFVRGNLSIVRRTESDRQDLEGLPGDYFRGLKSDFSDVYEKSARARRAFAEKIDPAWEDSFRRASRDFKDEYDKSGQEHNSLEALGPILAGYLQAFDRGFATPAAKTLVRGTAAGASTAAFLPAAAATIVVGRTVQSAGLTLFYSGRTGVHLISPTLEGGFFAGVALLSIGAVPPTYVGGQALGAVNQVAFTAAAPMAAAGRAAASGAYDSGVYVGSVLYDAGAGATKVTIDQAESGVVLGYNALTAIPAQALLGVGDGAIFLAWDGPRLFLAAAHGRLKSAPDDRGYSVDELPAGTVVDLKALERDEGVKVVPLSTDPAVIRRVLENIPDDARVPDADR